jgi:hypothetical protein
VRELLRLKFRPGTSAIVLGAAGARSGRFSCLWP